MGGPFTFPSRSTAGDIESERGRLQRQALGLMYNTFAVPFKRAFMGKPPWEIEQSPLEMESGGAAPNPQPAVAPTAQSEAGIPASLRDPVLGQFPGFNPMAPPPTPFSTEQPGYMKTSPFQPSYTPPPPGPSMRAIRMPNGKFLFTNRSDSDPDFSGRGGTEIPTTQAGREMRQASRSAQIGPPEPPSMQPPSFSPRGLEMRNLVRSSLESSEGPDMMGETPGGYGGSPVAMNKDVERRLSIEDAMGATALAQAQGAREAAEIPIREAMAMGNPDIQAAQYTESRVAPRLTALRNDYAKQLQALEASTLGEKEKKIERKRLDNDYMNARRDVIDVGTLMRRQSVPQ